MKSIILTTILSFYFIVGIEAQDLPEVTDDNQGIALNLVFNLNIPVGFETSPALIYRTKFRPFNRPLHFFVNPNMGITKKSDAERINSTTGQLTEGESKYKFGFSPQFSVGIPIFYNSKYRIANVLKGVDYKETAVGTTTTYFLQQGYVPTHQALLAEFGFVKYPEYDAYGPTIFYGLRWFITQKGKVKAEEEGYHYKVKQVMSLYLHLFKRLDSDNVFANIPEDNLRKTGYKLTVEYTKGGAFGMMIGFGGCPGRKNAYGGTSGVLGYLDVGVYKVIGLMKAPL